MFDNQIAFAALLLSLSVCCAFDANKRERVVWERAMRPPFIVVDDYAYSPHVSCPQTSDPDAPAARPLRDIFSSASDLPPARRQKRRRLLRRDDDPAEYYFDNRIHALGNTGPLGFCHSLLAPIFTKGIDVLAYDGTDVRSVVSTELHQSVGPNARVLDLGCGAGFSTTALKHAFCDGDLVVGLDTSPEHLAVARFIETAKGWGLPFSPGDTNSSPMRFAQGNAERTVFPDKSFDLITIMYAFHEIPYLARYRILREVRRLLVDGGTLAIVDISPDYEPSSSMLHGEPYVHEYQANIHKQLGSIRGFQEPDLDFFQTIVPGHVCSWVLRKQIKPFS